MISVIWVNFSGSSTHTNLLDSDASVIVGDLVSKSIGPSHTFTCNCGQCGYVEVDDKDIVNNKVNHRTEIKQISLDGRPVNFDTFTKEFCAAFFDAVKEKFPNAYFSAWRNIAINTKEGELDVPAIMKSMEAKLIARGYSFELGETKAKVREDNFPLQIDNKDRNKLVTWLVAQNIPEAEMQRPSLSRK